MNTTLEGDRKALTAVLWPLLGAHADVTANHLIAAGYRHVETLVEVCDDDYHGETPDAATVYGHHGSRRNCIKVGEVWVHAPEA